jgi:hypothetical protein
MTKNNEKNFTKLKINGYKNILRMEEKSKLNHDFFTSDKVKITLKVFWDKENTQIYYLFDTGIQVIGYTDKYTIIAEILQKMQENNLTYLEFWQLCGRN